MTDAPSNGTPIDRPEVRVSFVNPHYIDITLQTEREDGYHHGLRFVDGPADWLIVYDDFRGRVYTKLPWERRILFVSEPPLIRRYPAGFANQFGILVSPFPIAKYHGVWVESQPAIPWWYSVSDPNGKGVPIRVPLAALRASPPDTASKIKKISIICSGHNLVPRHQERMALIDALDEALPNRVDLFGYRFRTINQKAEAIDPYRYHLVIENNLERNFWTEKLADCYLGLAMPIFSGCKNVTDYFPERSMEIIPDIADHRQAIEIVRRLLDADPYETRLEAIRRAREKLIDVHNLPSVIKRVIDEFGSRPAPALPSPQRIYRIRHFKGVSGYYLTLRSDRLARHAVRGQAGSSPRATSWGEKKS